MTRKHLAVKRIVHIGKESDNLEDTEHFGIGDDAYQVYADGSAKVQKDNDLRAFILNLKPQIVHKYGISKLQIIRMRNKIKAGIELNLSWKNKNKLGKIIRIIRIKSGD